MFRRLLGSGWTYVGLGVLLVLLAAASVVRVHVPTRPRGGLEELKALRSRSDVNVVFILVDTLRADRLSTYGYKRTTSPVLTDLASRGVRFAHVEAQSSWTKSSMASLWTSLVPPRSGITKVEEVLPDSVELPAERLQKAGFRTAGIFRNAWVAGNFGFGQGFETYVFPGMGQAGAKLEVRQRNPGVAAIPGSDEDATNSALSFIQSYGNDRFFLYVHYMDVHQYVSDQQAADLGWGTRLTDAYDKSIHWMDRNVGQLVWELEKRDLMKKTIVVLAADHGEGFWEHGEGHAHTLYREVTHVPWIIALPFLMPHEVVVEPVVRNVDIWPTLFDLLGMEPPATTDGRSQVPSIEAALRGEKPGPTDGWSGPVSYLNITWGNKDKKTPTPLVSVLRDGVRFIYGPETQQEELYDEKADPDEQHNIAESRPDEVKALRGEAQSVLQQTPPWGSSPTVELDDLHREQLRALGYIVR